MRVIFAIQEDGSFWIWAMGSIGRSFLHAIFFPRICQCSEASQYRPGSRACLRALEALVFFSCQKCIFLLLLILLFKFSNVHLYGYITKYIFQYERFWPFWQMQFSLSWCENIKGLICSFGLVDSILFCNLGVWGPKWGPRSCCTFNCKIWILPLFLILFFKKYNYYLCRHITKYLFQYKRFWVFWQICPLKLV